jgi:hypothetical protein
MAQYSSADFALSIKDNGGTPRVITPYVRAVGSISIEAILQESTSFGVAWAAYVSTMIKKMAAITIGGFYDTAATTGPDVIFSGYVGNTRTGTVFTFGGAKTVTVDVIIQKYERLPKLGAMTEYQATLQPTGTATEA